MIKTMLVGIVKDKTSSIQQQKEICDIFLTVSESAFDVKAILFSMTSLDFRLHILISTQPYISSF
jgi:hypothetical protein